MKKIGPNNFQEPTINPQKKYDQEFSNIASFFLIQDWKNSLINKYFQHILWAIFFWDCI